MKRASVTAAFVLAIVLMACESRAQEGPLHSAAKSGDLSAVKTLIAAGADLEARDKKYGSTPLHWAASLNANPAVVEALIAAGADPKALDKDGRLPFDLAKNNKALKGTDVFWRLMRAF